MTIIKGYFLTSEERDIFKENVRSKTQFPSESNEFNYFRDNSLKIGALFAIYHHVDDLNFTKERKDLFTDSAAIFYTDDKMKIQNMKKYSKNVLINQTIVGIASNWESYFSGIIQTIYNDKQYLNYSTKIERKSQFKKMLKTLNINSIFELECTKNNQKINQFQFGKKIIKSKKIKFSQPNQIAKIMNCFGIDFVKHAKSIQPRFLEDLNKLFVARNIIVHEQDDTIGNRTFFKNTKLNENTKIAEIYSLEKNMENLKNMHRIINHIDVILFSEYEI
jgi:hypothetical protein